MTAAEIVAEAARVGVLLRVDESRIVARPASALPPMLADEIRANRDDVLSYLVTLPRTSVPGAAPADADRGTLVCYSCGSIDFWRGRGVVVCRTCHPPVPGAEVLTSSRTSSGAPAPVEIDAGSTAATTAARTNDVRGGAR